jgi:hypothetical protein
MLRSYAARHQSQHCHCWNFIHGLSNPPSSISPLTPDTDNSQDPVSVLSQLEGPVPSVLVIHSISL